MDSSSPSDPLPMQAGANRFSGFSDLYDKVRPSPPEELAELLVSYAASPVAVAVDLGSGTGLSTRWAAGWADAVVGVEPSDDMRAIAERGRPPNVTNRPGWSHETGLAAGSVDVVLAVQSLHWMEPDGTLAEVARLLRPGGLFAAIDCDWPPVLGDVEVERAWDRCRRVLWAHESRLAEGTGIPDRAVPPSAEEVAAERYSGSDAHIQRALVEGVRSWSKTEHLSRMIASHLFDWCREFVLTASEEGNADRLIGLLKSQGDYQALIRHGFDDASLGVNEFAETAEAVLGERFQPWRFVYRVRLGVTPS